jgi:hypothetical protein
LRGTVTSAETGQPLGYSIVTLHPNMGEQFTDTRGTFAFEDTGAGTYLLSVRQIGYTPLDTQIVISSSGQSINVALRRLAIELPPVTIAALSCTNPGPPSSSDSTLFVVFDQLQENARRYELLTKAYPFQYTLELSEKTVNQHGDTGKPNVRKLHFSNNDDHPYAVGRVVEPPWGPWASLENTLIIRDADLPEFGNAEFIAHHCFQLAGVEPIGGDTLLRIDFEPSMRIGTPDMSGSAYLDPITYELRYSVTRLTHPERSDLADVRALTSWARFRNIAPGVPLQDSLSSVTTYRYSRRVTIRTQRALDIRFKHPPPS